VVQLTGTLFDVSYDNSSFMYQTSTVPDPATGTPVPFYEQIGGFSFVAADTVRYSLRPKEVFGDPATVVPGGAVQVGGSALSTDSAADAASFDVVPKAGNQAFSVLMSAVGYFDNSGTESATLTYVQGLTAAGASAGGGGSLGVFSSGPLTGGSLAGFALRTAPFGVAFNFTLEGVSSSFDFISSANVSYIDFKVSTLPVPEPQTWMLMLGGLAAVAGLSRRRRA
jgi:hypothetical protein